MKWIKRLFNHKEDLPKDVEFPPPLCKRRSIRKVALKTYYRLSDHGYNKVKPDYINNFSCLSNYANEFGKDDLYIIADNVSDETYQRLCKEGYYAERTQFGNGAASFRHALDLALLNSDNTLIYFLEDDYLHRAKARNILIEGLFSGADYVSLYDHPDKYIDRKQGGENPFIDSGGELTRVILTQSAHWKITNSTTMTFAAGVETLKRDKDIIREFIQGPHPRDFDMFLALRQRGRTLITPIPGYSTHGETKWLSALTDWRRVAG